MTQRYYFGKSIQNNRTFLYENIIKSELTHHLRITHVFFIVIDFLIISKKKIFIDSNTSYSPIFIYGLCGLVKPSVGSGIRDLIPLERHIFLSHQ